MKQRQTFLLGFVLVILTLAIYWPAIHYDFVVVDDDLYVFENPWVMNGLCLSSLNWAFTTLHVANWHPVTWISHMLDCSIYGMFPGGHHLTNVVFHGFDALLLFLLLKGLTRRVWPAFIVAALFAWHPLHVESVAWISERKDVLSTFFFLLTLMAYTKYALLRDHGTTGPRDHATAERPDCWTIRSQDYRTFYVLSLLLFALGLMSKSMVVTLPFVLLLLDCWPLKRFQLSNFKSQFSVIRRILVEKLPFFALALGASVITLVAQHGGGAIRSAEEVPLGLRTLNGFAAYARYLGHTVYPTGLCPLYPLSPIPPTALGAISALALGGITWLLFRLRSKYPWALVGWLWFVGTLIPVIGFVQVGMQSMADRYTYIPLIGLFLMAVLIVDYGLSRWRVAPGTATGVACVPLLLCLCLTRHQLAYWHDSVTLFTRAVSVTRDNAIAENNLGVALARKGERAEAVHHYRNAVRINPNYAQAQYNLGVQLADSGQFDEAGFYFSEALKSNPNNEILHNNLGVVLSRQDKLDLAISEFRRAIALNPRYPKPYFNYGKVLQSLGQAGGAATNYTKALNLDPDWPEALDKLAWLLATYPEPESRQPQMAIKLASRAAELTHRSVPAYLETLACAYAVAGQFSNAVDVAGEARDLALKDNLLTLVQQLDNELETYGTGRCSPVDWRTTR
jgi:tetratricopeptide (TPR) repeat protein